MQVSSDLGMKGQLATRVIRAPRPGRRMSLRVPGGRLSFQRDREGGKILASQMFATSLRAVHRDRRGKILEIYDLGSGAVTNVGVLSMANDFAWPAPSGAAINILRLANNHASGTGATAAATTDIKLQTPSAFGGQTMVAGVQSLVSAANSQKYQSVATISYTGTETVTEWGLLGNLGAIGGTALSSATGSPFTAGGATSGTVTGTPLTASTTTVQGQANTVAEDTNGTRVDWGLVLSNTTSVLTVPAWYKTADGTAGTAPVNADTMVFRPVLWDHKVFTGIGVNSGDSIQFTYVLTITAGG